MVVIFAFAALSIDMSFLALNKTQLQAGSDASAHSAGIELVQGDDVYVRSTSRSARRTLERMDVETVLQMAATTFNLD